MKTRIILLSIIVAAVCAIAPISYYLNFGDFDISKNPEDWGVLGDFLGGVLNPVLSFAAFISLLATIFMQQRQLKQSESQLELTRKELSLSIKELKRSADAQDKQIDVVNTQNFEATFFNLLGRFEAATAHVIRVYLEDEIRKDENVPSSFSADRDIRYCGFEHLRYQLYGYQKHYSSEPTDSDPGHRCSSEEAYMGISTLGTHGLVLDTYFMHFKFIVDFIEESELQDKRKYYRILFSELTNGELIFVFYQVLYGKDLLTLKDKIEEYSLFEYIGYQGLINNCEDLGKFAMSSYGNNRSININMQHWLQNESNAYEPFSGQ